MLATLSYLKSSTRSVNFRQNSCTDMCQNKKDQQKYSTAQLQGNVRTRLKRVQDASGTHVRRVHASAKPCNKAATRRTRVPRPFFARRWARPERV